MPTSAPHPLALFSLIPKTDHAKTVTAHPKNRAFARAISEDIYALDIGFHVSTRSRHVLASIGRSLAQDIHVAAADVSRIQCSFEIVPNTKTIMLRDHSTLQSTRFFGSDAQSFEDGQTPRRVLIHPRVNTCFGFGGIEGNLYIFEICWHEQFVNINYKLRSRDEPPCNAPTIDDTPTAVTSRIVTRKHIPQVSRPRLRYIEDGRLGSGAFGQVHSVLDVDSGDRMARKRLPYPKPHERSLINQRDLMNYEMVKREVRTLERMVHPNILEFVAAQLSMDQSFVEIFTSQKTGDVDRLMAEKFFLDRNEVNRLLEQMLQAIDYLDSEGLIHRDIKPANILFTPNDAGYRYQLADFGLADNVSEAVSLVGSKMYMAPEILDGVQSSKMDVWSLLVTIMDVVDEPSGFRTRMRGAMGSGSLKDQVLRVANAVCETAELPLYHGIGAMARLDPNDRSSAGDMLDALFGGTGRITKRTRHVANPMRNVPESAATPSSLQEMSFTMGYSGMGSASDRGLYLMIE